MILLQIAKLCKVEPVITLADVYSLKETKSTLVFLKFTFMSLHMTNIISQKSFSLNVFTTNKYVLKVWKYLEIHYEFIFQMVLKQSVVAPLLLTTCQSFVL